MSDLKAEVKSEILRGSYSSAYLLCENLPQSEIEDVLHSIAYSDNILAYGFCCYILMHTPTAENHILASTICATGCDIIGSYTLAYHHGKEAVRLSNEIKYKEYMLGLYTVPDIEMSIEEAIGIANKILELEPDNELALSFIDAKYQPLGFPGLVPKQRVSIPSKDKKGKSMTKRQEIMLTVLIVAVLIIIVLAMQ